MLFQDLCLIILELRTEDFAESKEADYQYFHSFHFPLFPHSSFVYFVLPYPLGYVNHL